MTSYAQTQAHDLAIRFPAGIAAAIRGAAARLEHYRVYRRTLLELQALSDRQLEDIGMERVTLKQSARAVADTLLRG